MNVISSAVRFTVLDPAASSDFFGTYLGYRESAATDDVIYLDRDDDAAEIVLERLVAEAAPVAAGHPVGASVCFTVTDIAAAYHRLRGAGAPITHANIGRSQGTRRVVLADPNGIVVHLIEWCPPSGA